MSEARKPALGRLAVLAVLVWGAHAMEVLVRGRPVELLWMCNVAGLVLAIGCAMRRAELVGIATSFLALGTPLWIGDLLAGGELYPTSVFSHWGGLAIGAAASRELGWDRHAWWRSTLSLLTLVIVTRQVPSAGAGNVNLAFSVWPGWEDLFPTYPSYFVFLFLACTAVFIAVTTLARWLLARTRGQAGARPSEAALDRE